MRTAYRREKRYTISVVAERYDVHPQTLRLYEREGLLAPSRSSGNTRYYTDDDLDRLEQILALTRDLGVNLAGVAVVFDLQDRMDRMREEFEQFVSDLRRHVAAQLSEHGDEFGSALMVRARRPVVSSARD